jgi:transposase
LRSKDVQNASMWSTVSPEDTVPENHPLRTIRTMVNEILTELSPEFSKIYARRGRPSIAPEKLLRARLLQVLYSIRSEPLLLEQLRYNLLFRWFVGLGMDDPIWDVSSFSKNRERFLAGEISDKFFEAAVAKASNAGLLSDEHFTVDGTLIAAWASYKSIKPKDDPGAGGAGRNPHVDFRGKPRTNETLASTTDPDARLYRKSAGARVVLGYLGHALMENRNGLIVQARVTHATGVAEREAALEMTRSHVRGGSGVTLGADKGYDTADFVRQLRALDITPHVAQNDTNRRSSIDRRTTRHDGYDLSLRKRKLVEEFFGWDKVVGNLRQVHVRGKDLVADVFALTAAAYNLVRMRNLGVT